MEEGAQVCSIAEEEEFNWCLLLLQVFYCIGWAPVGSVAGQLGVQGLGSIPSAGWHKLESPASRQKIGGGEGGEKRERRALLGNNVHHDDGGVQGAARWGRAGRQDACPNPYQGCIALWLSLRRATSVLSE